MKMKKIFLKNTRNIQIKSWACNFKQEIKKIITENLLQDIVKTTYIHTYIKYVWKIKKEIQVVDEDYYYHY